MRILLFVLNLMTGMAALASGTVMGTVEKDSAGTYLVADASCKRFQIQTISTDAEISIRKLSTGDSLTASGSLNTETCVAEIESVDYVGLKKMLGHWHSTEGLMTVRDFNFLSFYPTASSESRKYPFYVMAYSIDYRYSLTPADGKDWVLFLSDTNTTTFATIRFRGNRATMKIYDSETGKVNRTLYMSKWGNL